jgi:hypothetical protein
MEELAVNNSLCELRDAVYDAMISLTQLDLKEASYRKIALYHQETQLGVVVFQFYLAFLVCRGVMRLPLKL